MKILEAELRIRQMDKEQTQLRYLFQGSLVTATGVAPEFDPDTLASQIDVLRDNMLDLKQRLERTRAQVLLPGYSGTLSDCRLLLQAISGDSWYYDLLRSGERQKERMEQYQPKKNPVTFQVNGTLADARMTANKAMLEYNDLEVAIALFEAETEVLP